MLSLFDMMTQAQNGAAMEAMSRQFDLAQDQAARAMAALAPPFSLALKRLGADPYGMSALMQSLATGDYQRYFEDLGKAFTPEGIAEGNEVLARLFGSKEVSEAIARQAAEMSGIGQEAMRGMLPVVADLLMGGLTKQTSGDRLVAANPFLNGTMTETLRVWLQGIGLVPRRQTSADLFDNPFTQAMQAFFTPQAAAKPKAGAGKPAAPNPFLDNPFLKAFEQMMAPDGAPEAAKSRGTPKSQAAETPEKTAEQRYRDLLNTMFDSGLEVRKTYERSIETILDSYRPKTPTA